MPVPDTVYLDQAVNCDGCIACCKREIVSLVEGDDPSLYCTVVIPRPNPFTQALTTVMLAHKPNGDCVYLGDKGCTIYDQRPRMCKAFSCVDFVAKFIGDMPRSAWRRKLRDAKRQRQVNIDGEVFKAGLKRLREAE